MQQVCCRIEAAALDNRGERSQLLTVDAHISDANADEESLAVLMRVRAPSVVLMNSPLIVGFLASFTLIAAIGAQNAFVLRQGIRREHVLPVVAMCTVSDIALIAAGIAGFGVLINAHPVAVDVSKIGGAFFLVGYGLLAARRAWRPSSLKPADAAPARLAEVLITCAAMTFLNPHVYLDTVVLLGALANQHPDGRWLFGVGAVTASAVWFVSLGLGARRLAGLFAAPVTWRILDGLIAATMIALGAAMLVSA
jgi:L-lysine exporter family protein LysE/ArgO